MNVSQRAVAMAAGAGMIAVLATIAVLTIWSLVQSRSDLDAVSRSVDVSNGYRDAVNAATLAELYGLRVLSERDTALREDFVRAFDGAIAAADHIRDIGDDEDRALIDNLESQLGPEIQRAAVLNSLTQEQLEALEVGEIVFADLHAVLGPPAEARHREAIASLAAFRRGQTTRSVLILVAFFVGVPSLVLLRKTMRAYERREVRSQVEVEKLKEAALTDSLTGLGNHRAFQEELRRQIAVTTRSGLPLTVAMMDIDDFKLVNDANGHAQGDRVLAEVAHLMSYTRPEDRAFRVGGDEFAYLMHASVDSARQHLEQLLSVTSKALGGVSMSIGVASSPGAGMDADGLRERADLALYEAKRRGKNQVIEYEDGFLERGDLPLAKARAFRDILQGGNLRVVFQPIVKLEGGGVMAFEALARPDDPDLQRPDEAFEIADRLGRCWELDMLCLSKAFAAARELPENSTLFVNLDPRSLANPEFEGALISRMARMSGIDPTRIVVELTERTAIAVDLLLRGLGSLRAEGFRVALDDVGSGNSGLKLLRSARFDFVKIDRSVILSAVDRGPGRAVVIALVALGNELGAQVIAEGVENEAMLAVVKSAVESVPHMAVLGVQGYLFGRPATVKDLGAGRMDPESPTRAA